MNAVTAEVGLKKLQPAIIRSADFLADILNEIQETQFAQAAQVRRKEEVRAREGEGEEAGEARGRIE